MYTLPTLHIKKNISRIAVLTSGGDAPGMNAAIRAVVRTALSYSIETLGIYRGYSGLIEGDIHPLTSASVENIIQRGGTLLRSDRCLEFKHKSVRQRAYDTLVSHSVEALVVIGGDGSLTGAHLLGRETGLPVIGIPGTIDNDICLTDDTIGFDTAVNTALNAIDRIRDTADSHGRVFLVEVMGRDSGHIASEVGIAGGADYVVLPDSEIHQAQAQAIIQQSVKAKSQQPDTQEQSQYDKSQIIIVAEGSSPGRTQSLAQHLIEQGQEPRMCILGHIQRGGSPTGHDRVLASSLGSFAVKYLLSGHQNHMVGVNKGAILAVPLAGLLKESPSEKELQTFEPLWDLLK